MASETKFKETEIGLIPEDWEIKNVEYFCKKVTSGGTPSRKNMSYWKEGTISWLKTKELFDNNIYDTEEKITEQGLKNSSAKLFPENTVIMAMYGATVGQLGILKKELATNQACCAMIVNETKANYSFLYYSLLYSRDKLINLACGAAQQNLNQNIIKQFKLPFPPLYEQNNIASILKSLDDKIELNNQMNKTLEQIAQTLFKHWFIDFEFPDENGNPYKSSGGRMVDSELGEIPEGWEVGVLGEIIEIFDSKRVPLSSREREKRKGKYPYYGASSIMDYVDDYIFDGIFFLMGEDGTVIDEEGYPILQYVWSKFWVNNHAHVLKGKHPFSTEYLLLLLKTMKIQHVVTGAVQLKINQKNLKGLQILIPQEKTLKSFNNSISNLFGMYRQQNEEILTLSQIRDSLLPKLMSGKICVQI